MPLTWTRGVPPGTPSTVKVSVEPTAEPISTEQLWQWMRTTGTKYDGSTWDNDRIVASAIIPAARRAIEEYTGRSLITQTRVAYFDASQMRERLRLWGGPVQSISSIVVTDDDGDTTTQTASTYYLADENGRTPYVVLGEGETWPDEPRAYHAMAVTYVAGYGATAIGTPDYNDTGANGAGDNALTTGGTYYAPGSATARVQIATATTFKVSWDGGVTFGSSTTIDGEYQAVSAVDGVYVKFPATSGYSPGDYWDIALTGHGVPQQYIDALLMLAAHQWGPAQFGRVSQGNNPRLEQSVLPPQVLAILGARVRA